MADSAERPASRSAFPTGPGPRADATLTLALLTTSLKERRCASRRSDHGQGLLRGRA